MFRPALVIVCALVLGACSSNPHSQYDNYDRKYCHTDEKIVVENGQTVESKTIIECSDKFNPTATFKEGIDGSVCGSAPQRYIIGSKRYNNLVTACQLQNGDWTYVPPIRAY